MRPLTSDDANLVEKSIENEKMYTERLSDMNYILNNYLLKTDSSELGRLDMLVSLSNVTLQQVTLNWETQSKVKKLMKKISVKATQTKSVVRKIEALYTSSAIFKPFR